MADFSCCLISKNGAVSHALTYLCSIVLKKNLDVLSDMPATAQAVDRLCKKDIVFIFDDDHSDLVLNLIQRIKNQPNGPVVMVLAPPESGLATEAFFAGADDVVHWPTDLQELALRAYRRLGLPLDNPCLQIAARNYKAVYFLAERAGLSTAEAQVLNILYEHADTIVSRDALSLALDERPWRYGDRKYDVHVGRLRKKLAAAFADKITVATVRSEGYLFKINNNDFFAVVA